MKKSTSTRRIIIAASALGAAAVIGVAGTALAFAHREVTIEVDGVALPVSGFLTDVNSALAAGGVQVGAHDQVAPALDQAVVDGSTVVVHTASPYTLMVDGASVTAWSTADSVKDVIADAAAGKTKVAMPANRSQIRAELPLTSGDGKVMVRVDGKDVPVEAAVTDTAEQLLAKGKVKASPIDRVAFLNEGGALVLEVTRVTRAVENKTEPLAFQTEERENADMDKGTTEVLQEGVDGTVVTSVYRETVGGKVTVQATLGSTRTEPKSKIIAVGTKEKPQQAEANTSGTANGSGSGTQPAPAPSDVGSDVWAALAQCESGGDPTTNTGNGFYGMYQFTQSTWESVGGSGRPSEASAAEQTMRAQILQSRAGWGQWPGCAAKLGLL
ncbi:transglycosylase family protein [Schaalia sp. 19OD2882]|uniref:resuscitation-promoting factor n=1 Tax=Schaalia sp. 19OD2882 TaxID=2794089 RepID=UPI001C1E9DE2|nr:resuscitation-promoting factor [Schaalia sp. 19OD2882]QWW20047.1 transglycosylase family protein [Schaalia sp. 19OD2882]